MEEKNLHGLLLKNYQHIYNITYLCTGDKEFAKEISLKIFAKLYHANPWFMEEITYKKWLLTHTLSLINTIYKSSAKKDKKINNALTPLNYEQIATLYMDECMELPFEVIVEVLGGKSGDVRKKITKGKSLLLSSKEIVDIKAYIEDMIKENGEKKEGYDYLIQAISNIDRGELDEWEKSFQKAILKKRITRYCIIFIPPLLAVLAVCITSYIMYDNYNVFEVMRFGNRGEEFEVDSRAVEDGRSFYAEGMTVTLEKSWYDEDAKQGYCYFVISCEGRDMRLEDIEVLKYGQKSIQFGMDNKYKLELVNMDEFGRMYDIKYYTTKEALYLGFNFEIDKVWYGCMFGINFVDWYNGNLGMCFEFGTLSGGDPKYE